MNKSAQYETTERIESTQVDEKIIQLFFLFGMAYAAITAVYSFLNENLYVLIYASSFSISLLLAGIFMPNKWIKRYFLFTVLMFSILVLGLKFVITNSNGSGPLQSMLELVLSITIVYLYGFKKGGWLPVLFIGSTFIRLWMLKNNVGTHWIVLDAESLRINLIGVCLILFVLAFSGTFTEVISKEIIRYKLYKEDLDLAQTKLNLQTIALEESYQQIEQLADLNSHRLRAPVARIQGLMLLMQELQTNGVLDDHDEIVDLDLKSELEKSIIELKDEMDQFTKVLKSN